MQCWQQILEGAAAVPVCEVYALCMAIEIFHYPVCGLELTIRLGTERCIEQQIRSKVIKQLIQNLLKNHRSPSEMITFAGYGS